MFMRRGPPSTPVTKLAYPFSTSLPSNRPAKPQSTSRPKPFRIISYLLFLLCPPEQWSKTLVLKELPSFAIEEDVRQFFEESNFSVYVSQAHWFMARRPSSHAHSCLLTYYIGNVWL